MTQCLSCGLIQLLDDTPVEFVRPRVPWIRYNEPDGHIDDLADRLASRTPKAGASAFGVGPFDQPLLDALARRQIRTSMLDLQSSGQGGADAYPYLETLQQSLRPIQLSHVAERYGVADIVLCRYLLEHSHDPVGTLLGLRQIMSDEGCLVVEIPDSSKFIRRQDYSFIWEEHICYFVEDTLRGLAMKAGFGVDAILRYEGLLEDALVAILRPRSGAVGTSPMADKEGVSSPSFQEYRDAFARNRDAYHKRLEALTARGGKVALIGVGHQAVMFVNAMGLQHYISFMVDDDHNKQASFVPGTTKRIVPSASLLRDNDISACLLAVSPRVEAKVRERLRPLFDRGVQFFTLFPAGGGKTLLEDA